MTDHTPAAQAAMQEGERIAAADEYFSARTWIMDTNDNRRIFEAGFDRAYALLSKLRAPVADELVDSLARYAYYYAVDLDRHTRNADLDQLEGISRRATAKLKAEIRATLTSAQVDPEAAEVDFMVRVFENLDTWRAEDWNELLERRPAILALLRPMVLASAPVAGEAQADLAPPKCPITGRPFFMALEHPELGRVPTYGGPYDSYTIPHLGGKPDQPWHERDLRVYRYDHDLGGWIADETEVIPLRIVHEDVLHGLEDAAPQASEADAAALSTAVDYRRMEEAPQASDELPTPAQMDALAEFIYQDMGSPSDWMGFDKEAARRLLARPAPPASSAGRDADPIPLRRKVMITPADANLRHIGYVFDKPIFSRVNEPGAASSSQPEQS